MKTGKSFAERREGGRKRKKKEKLSCVMSNINFKLDLLLQFEISMQNLSFLPRCNNLLQNKKSFVNKLFLLKVGKLINGMNLESAN